MKNRREKTEKKEKNIMILRKEHPSYFCPFIHFPTPPLPYTLNRIVLATTSPFVYFPPPLRPPLPPACLPASPNLAVWPQHFLVTCINSVLHVFSQ